MKNRITVFAHWDKDNRIADYVLYYLEELSTESDIIFVSDCPLPEREKDKVAGLARQVIAAPHGEYDFGSYKRGYQYLRGLSTDQYDEFILANDSCYGPFYPFKDLFARMAGEDVDFWGIFEHHINSNFDRHLQSFFIVFKKDVWMSEAFAGFFEGVRRLGDKLEIVKKYEAGLTQLLIARGFRYTSLIDFHPENLTYTIDAFDMICNQGMPFLKRRLLTENPAHCPELITPVRKFFTQEQFAVVLDIITADLKRLDCSYRDRWHIFKSLRTQIVHRKFFSIEEKVYPKKPFTVVRVVFLGFRILKMKGRRNVQCEII